MTDWDRHISRTSRPDQNLPMKHRLVRTGSEPDIQAYYAQQQNNARPAQPLQPTGSLPMYRGNEPRYRERDEEPHGYVGDRSRHIPERRSMGPSYGRPHMDSDKHADPRAVRPGFAGQDRGRSRDRHRGPIFDQRRSQSLERRPREPYQMSEEVRKMALEHLGKPRTDHAEPIYRRPEYSRNQRQPDPRFHDQSQWKPEDYRNPRNYPGHDAHGYNQPDPYFARRRQMSDPNLARTDERPNYYHPPQQRQQPPNRSQPTRQSDHYSPAEKIINKYKEAKSPPVDKQISHKEDIYAVPQKLSERDRLMPRYTSEPQLQTAPMRGRYPERKELPQPRYIPDQYSRVPSERVNRTETGPLPQQRPDALSQSGPYERVPPLSAKQGPQDADQERIRNDYYDQIYKRQHPGQRQDNAPHHRSVPSLHTEDQLYYPRDGRSQNYQPENRYSGPYDDRYPNERYGYSNEPHSRQQGERVPTPTRYTSQANITMSSPTTPSEKKVPDQYDRQLSQELPNPKTSLERAPENSTSGIGAPSQIVSQPPQQLQPDKEPKLPSEIWKSLVQQPSQPTKPFTAVSQPSQYDKPKPSQVWSTIVSGGPKDDRVEEGKVEPSVGKLQSQIKPDIMYDALPKERLEVPTKRSIVTVKVPGQSEPKNVDASYHTPSEDTQEFKDADAVMKREDMVKELKGVFENKMTMKEDPPQIEHSFIKWAPPEKKGNFRMEPHPLAKITPKDHAFPVMLKGKEPEGPALYKADEKIDPKDEIKNVKDISSIKENLFGPDGEPIDAQVPAPNNRKSPAQNNGRPKSPWESEVVDEYISEYASYKDTLQKRRPQIHDDLTELEQIYDGMALDADDEIRHGSTPSAFRPVLKDKTHRQNLQESPSMEYAKQWLISDGGNDNPKIDKDEMGLLSHSYIKSPSVASTASLQGKLPKKIGDDMAFRKHKQAVNSTPEPLSQTRSYTGPSPGITPSVSTENLKSGSTQSKNGIVPSKTSADYMEPRTTTPQRERFRSKAEKDADKYHDDLAYRNLRKDLPPVTVKLPGLAEFHQRIRSRSLERTKGASDKENLNRSSSNERDSNKKQGDPAKLPVSSGVAKMVQMFSSTAQSAPDLTDQAIFDSKKYDALGNIVDQNGSSAGQKTADTKTSLTKPSSKQTVRGVKQKNEKTKTKQKPTTAGEPDEASYNDAETDSGTDLLRSSPDGAMETDTSSPKQSPSQKASSDSGFSKTSGDSPRSSYTAAPVQGGTLFSLALTEKTATPRRTEPAPNKKYTTQSMSLKPVSSSSIGGATSPFKPIEPHKLDAEFGPESMEVQNINRSPVVKSPEKKSGISSPLTKASLISTEKKSLIQPRMGLLQPKGLPSSIKTMEITRDFRNKMTTLEETTRNVTKQPQFPVISHKTQHSQDSQLSLGDMVERADDEVSDVESLAVLVAKQGIMSPYEDFDFSDYENIRSSPEPSKTPVLQQVLNKPPKSETSQVKEIIKPTPVLPATEVKMRPGREENQRRTVEVMLKPDSENKSWEPRLPHTAERSDRPKSFHELVANFESQACPLFRGSQGGVWKQLRKVSSVEGLHTEQ